MILINEGIPEKLFDAVASATGNSSAFSLPARASQITWQTSFGSAPASITIQLQTSLDNLNWNTIDTSTSTVGENRTIATSALFMRARINAVSGGSGITVSLVCKIGFSGLTTPSSVTDGSLALFDGVTGSKFKELAFPGDTTTFLRADGTFASAGGGGGGNVSTSGSPISGEVSIFSGASVITGFTSFQAVGVALPTPSAPTLSILGTPGSTTVGYTIQALNSIGHTTSSIEVTIATAPATLNSTNKVHITHGAITGASTITVYRTTAGGTPNTLGLIGTIPSSGGSLDDTGQAPTSGFGSFGANLPTGNSTDGTYLGAHLRQVDLGDTTDSIWLGPGRETFPIVANNLLGFSKFVFTYSGDGNNVIDTAIVLYSGAQAGNGIECINLTNNVDPMGNPNQNFDGGAGIYMIGGNIGAAFSNREFGVYGFIHSGLGSGGIGTATVYIADNGQGTGAVDTYIAFGLRNALSAGATHNYDFYSLTDINGTKNYAFYGAGSAPSHFGGSVDITGDLAATTYHVGASAGIDASITSGGLVGKTITVSKGIITGFA